MNLFITIVHVLTYATSRYRIPFMPILMVYAGHALTSPRSLAANASRRSAIAAVVVLLFFLGVCVPYFFVYGGRR